jgi:CheY-like chemotaxis protein
VWPIFRPRSIPSDKWANTMQCCKGRILYTEDDYDCREMVLFTLRKGGYEVTCVDSGIEALALAKTETFDLFLVDNWLPELSGPGSYSTHQRV